MNKPHKHAAVIKAWADGASIQLRGMRCSTDPLGQLWHDCDHPTWLESLEYRVKHRWIEVEDAGLAGKTIQYRRNPAYQGSENLGVVPVEWTDFQAHASGAGFDGDFYEWRVKPEHPWAEVEAAFKAGKTVQVRASRRLVLDDWHDYEGQDPDFENKRWEWRIKPLMRRYRLAIAAINGSNPWVIVVNAITNIGGEKAEKAIETQPTFVRWLTDWVEYEA